MRNGLLITGWEFLYRPSASESPFMTYVNAPLTPAGRLRVGLRHLDDRIPKSRVAAEFCVRRSAVITWAARYLGSDEGGAFRPVLGTVSGPDGPRGGGAHRYLTPEKEVVGPAHLAPTAH